MSSQPQPYETTFAGTIHGMEDRHQHMRGVIMGDPSQFQQPAQPLVSQQPLQSTQDTQEAQKQEAPSAKAGGFQAMLRRRMYNRK